METEKQTPNPDVAVKTYFLQQGHHISRLNDILDSNLFTHYVSKWLSALVETVLYGLFIMILICVFTTSNDISYYFEVNESTQLRAQISNSDLSAMILCFKILLAILSLPILAFALLLGRNRKKNTLIREAYEESLHMKHRFDQALKTLNL